MLEACGVNPSIINSKPLPGAGDETVISPDGLAQVGCNVAVAVGADGAPGTTFTVKLKAGDTHVLSIVLLAVTLYDAGVRPLKSLKIDKSFH